MTRKNKLLTGTALAAVLAFPLALSAASEMVGMQAGKTTEEITATLAAQGYEVRKVEAEDGELEAYVVKNGKRLEIYVDPASGAVTKVKEDD